MLGSSPLLAFPAAICRARQGCRKCVRLELTVPIAIDEIRCGSIAGSEFVTQPAHKCKRLRGRNLAGIRTLSGAPRLPPFPWEGRDAQAHDRLAVAAILCGAGHPAHADPGNGLPARRRLPKWRKQTAGSLRQMPPLSRPIRRSRRRRPPKTKPQLRRGQLLMLRKIWAECRRFRALSVAAWC